MSRYYDPITHRFVNSDGYFQSGGDLLDTNMNAYCRNNPVNCYDPTGTYCKEHGSYYKPNCTVCNPFYREYKQQQKPKSVVAQYVTSDNTNYYGPCGSPIKTYSGYGSSVIAVESSSPYNVYSNYINNDVFSSRVGISTIDSDVNIGFNGIKISTGYNYNSFADYMSIEYLAKEHIWKIGWDSSYSSEGMMYYNNGGICIDEKPIAFSLAVAVICPYAVPFVLA